MNRASVFEWHKRFKEGRESVKDDERCGRSKEVNTPELIGQRVRVRVRVTMLLNQSLTGCRIDILNCNGTTGDIIPSSLYL